MFSPQLLDTLVNDAGLDLWLYGSNRQIRYASTEKFSVYAEYFAASAFQMDDLDQAVVETFTRYVLTPELLDQCLADLAAASAAAPPATDRRAGIELDLARVEAKLSNLIALVESGSASASILGAIKAREDERRDLKAQLEHVDDLAKAARRDVWTLEQLQVVITDSHKYLTLSVPTGRQKLRMLLDGQITVTPTGPGGLFRYSITSSLAKVLGGKWAFKGGVDMDESKLVDETDQAGEQPGLPVRKTPSRPAGQRHSGQGVGTAPRVTGTQSAVVAGPIPPAPAVSPARREMGRGGAFATNAG